MRGSDERTGSLFSYVDLEGTGLISGDDGLRYPFVRGSLQNGVRYVSPGTEVDFQIEDGKAVAVGGALGTLGTSGVPESCVALMKARVEPFTKPSFSARRSAAFSLVADCLTSVLAPAWRTLASLPSAFARPTRKSFGLSARAERVT